jgi:ribosomal protein S18 acetylase RimI-like enzyme
MTPTLKARAGYNTRRPNVLSVDVTTLAPARWELFRAIRLESLSDDPALERNYHEESTFDEGYWRANIGYGFFALDGDRAVGVILYSILDDDIGPYAKIFGLHVNQAYRRQGIAGRLMGGILGVIVERESVPRAVLSVDAELEYAVRLYRRYGFDVVTVPGAAATAAGADLTMYKFL